MATRTRDKAASGREKRGTSPSHPIPRRPNPSKQSSPAKRIDSTSTTTEKNIPNYLKPTISSSHDATTSKQLGKKQVLTDAASRLMRRRSFDKPPSPSTLQRSRVSPSPTERTLRSSSFSVKSNTAQKAVPDRFLKSPRDTGKSRPLYARSVSSVKKSSPKAKKQEVESSASPQKEQNNPTTPERVDIPETSDIQEQHETQHDDPVSWVTDIEGETTDVGSDNDVLPEVLTVEDKEPVNVSQTKNQEEEELKEQKDEHVTIKSSESSEQKDVADVDKTEEPEEKPETGEINSKQPELEENSADESKDLTGDHSPAGKAEVEVEEKDADEAEVLDEKVDDGNEVDKQAEETEVKEVTDEVKQQETPTASAEQQGAQGKKDSSAVSNDVIEETASKLREQRKNKVKALAGAFETVISLQDPK